MSRDIQPGVPEPPNFEEFPTTGQPSDDLAPDPPDFDQAVSSELTGGEVESVVTEAPAPPADTGLAEEIAAGDEEKVPEPPEDPELLASPETVSEDEPDMPRPPDDEETVGPSEEDHDAVPEPPEIDQ